MIPSQFKSILAIENLSFDDPWTDKDLQLHLRLNGGYGMVVKVGGKIVGYILYRVEKKHIWLTTIAVHPEYRRQGYASLLLAALMPESAEKSKIRTVINDRWLNVHLFLKQVGFKAVSIERNFFGPDQDGYRFEYRIKSHRFDNAQP